MTSPRRTYTRKNRPAQAGELVGVRLQPAQLARIDAWRTQVGSAMTRPEAMRALIALALSGQDAPAPLLDPSEVFVTDVLAPAEATAHPPPVADQGLAAAAAVWLEEGQDSFIIPPPPPSISRSHEIEGLAKPLPAKAEDLLGPLGPIGPIGSPRRPRKR